MKPFEIGEARHEVCRHGIFSDWSVAVTPHGERPFVMPLCAWKPERAPPAVARHWGGEIDFARDCAVCPVFQRLEAV